VWRDHGTGENVAAVAANAETLGRTIDVDQSEVRSEVHVGIFGGEPALKGVSSALNLVLRQTQIWQGVALSYFNLRVNQVNSALEHYHVGRRE